ncbi:MAG: hypothetical protein Q9P90_04655 [candidate division KSB1 bacterium]|nr:hypothetical protein [candidate division KSB1 bacterium]
MKTYISLLSSLFIYVMALGCFRSDDHANNGHLPEPSQKILVGIAYDISGSVHQWPAPDTMALRDLAIYVGLRCGVIAVGHISDSSYQPLRTYDNLCLDTAAVQGSLTDKARIIRENKRKKAWFKQNLERFLLDVKQHVLVPRNKRRTDIAGSMNRFSILFQEPNYVDYEKILIILSDGFDTVNASFGEIPDVKIFLIGWRNGPLARKLFGNTFVRFESFSGAVKYILNMNKG